MSQILATVVMTIVGAVAGRWLTRHRPVDRQRVYCACASLFASVFLLVSPTQTADMKYVAMGTTVIMSGFLLASLLDRWERD